MPLRVVVVEDEYRIAELLLQLGHWEMLNLEVADVCYDGIHALESIQNNKPDIVLTDIRMPGCDGLELHSEGEGARPFSGVYHHQRLPAF